MRISDPYSGRLTALMLTQAGDVLAVAECAVVVDARSRTLTLLPPLTDVITPVSEAEAERLRALAREIEIEID